MDTPVDSRSITVGEAFDDVPLTSQHWKALFALFFAFVIEAWELLILVYVASDISAGFGISASGLGLLISSIFLGMIPGCLVWGVVADRIGRRRVVVLSLALYGVFALLSAFSVSYGMLFGLRFLAGFAMAGAFLVGFPYLEELLPTKDRGRFTVYLAAGWPIGTLIAVGISVALLPLGWRWVIGVSALAGLWCLVVARFVPESPYWLAGQNRGDEARAVIRQLSNNQTQVSQDLYVEEHKEGSVAEIFGRRLRGVTLVQMLVNFTFAWGYWGLNTWMPTLLQNRGFEVAQSLSFVAIFAVFMIPGYISAAFMTGRFGRKWVFIAYIALAAVGGVFFGSSTTPLQLWGGAFLLAFFAQGAWGVWDTWLGELYPSKLRAVGYSWGVLSQRVANTLAPITVGFLIAQQLGFTTTVLFINSFLAITAVAALYFVETEGKELA